MSLHSRPIPAPKKTLEDLVSSTSSTQTVLPAPHPTLQPMSPPSGRRSSEDNPYAEASRASQARAEAVPADGTSRPWYRREPWLAVMITAFAPLAAAIFAPDPARYVLIGLTGLALIVGAVMLIRQGVFHPHPDSGPSRK